jgi:hypothetical protein
MRRNPALVGSPPRCLDLYSISGNTAEGGLVTQPKVEGAGNGVGECSPHLSIWLLWQAMSKMALTSDFADLFAEPPSNYATGPTGGVVSFSNTI